MIIVFGSLNMDLFFNPPHAPEAGETVLLNNYEMLPGGKGANQAVAAAKMGAVTMMAGCVGPDGFAGQLLEYIGAQGVDTALVGTGRAQTGSAVIIVEPNGENRILVAAGANLEARAAQVPEELLRGGTTLLMQMETEPRAIRELAARGRQRGARVILNLAPAITPEGDTLAHVDYLILNEIEICQLAGQMNMPQGDYESAARAVARRYDLTCVVTLGPEGALAFGADGARSKAAALKLDRVVDTTGAGDAFSGAFAAALDGGETLETALRHACAAGSLACLRKGGMTASVTREEIAQALGRGSAGAAPSAAFS